MLDVYKRHHEIHFSKWMLAADEILFTIGSTSAKPQKTREVQDATGGFSLVYCIRL